jgi:hypothetical protein
VFRIPLGVYRLSLARLFCRRIPPALAAIEVTELVAIRPLWTFGRALCARPVHRLAMTVMRKSQRGLSDLSLLRGVSSGQSRFASGRSRRTGNRSADRRRRKTDGDEDPYQPLESPQSGRPGQRR